MSLLSNQINWMVTVMILGPIGWVTDQNKQKWEKSSLRRREREIQMIEGVFFQNKQRCKIQFREGREREMQGERGATNYLKVFS